MNKLLVQVISSVVVTAATTAASVIIREKVQEYLAKQQVKKLR